MKKQLQKSLFEKYPLIFQDKDKPMTETCMCWGIETGNGWYWLLDNLCNNIQSYINNNSKQTRIKNILLRKIGNYLSKIYFKTWNKTINKLRNFLYKYSKKEEYESIPQVIATQVKEKFGGLRFYYNGGNDKIDGMIWLTESLSYKICQNCGSIENVGQTTGWIYTICKNCCENEEFYKERNCIQRWKQN